MSFELKTESGTVNQIVDTNGEAYQATSATWSHADRDEHEASFAPARAGNKAEAFATGEKYFENVAKALEAAEKSIFIAGWQVNWDVELVKGKRLIDVLKKALDDHPELRIYVMPWMSPKVGVDTGDLGTMLAIFQLNAGQESMRAFCCPAGLQNDFSAIEETFFSHHQKQVVIDNKIAFVGGIDLAYGRRDDERFSLNHDWRKGSERYNPGIPPMHALQPDVVTTYLSTKELLETALTLGALSETQAAKKPLMQSAWGTGLGKKINQGIVDGKAWLKENHIPEWMKEPLQPIVRTVGNQIEQLQAHVVDTVITKLKNGTLKAEHVTAAIGIAAAAMKASYIALLGTAWAGRKPNAELMTPGMQALPMKGGVLADDQPRMPWQDVQMRIEGPSVYDLAMNFIRRWNSLQKAYLPSLMQKQVMISAALIPSKPSQSGSGVGNVEVRVLRSASRNLQRQETAAMGGKQPLSKQCEIGDMMVKVIKGANHFIYIENQFFQTDFGTPSISPDNKKDASAPIRYLMSQTGNRITAAITVAGGATHANVMPKNKIGEALGDRIEMAIRQGTPFHVYILLPVHPEGSLSDIAIVGQIHWTMQSLVYASHSLVNRIRIALAAAKLVPNKFDRLKKDGPWDAAKKKVMQETAIGQDAPYTKIEESEWREYLTLLNLRNCEKVGGKVRTEQIYVHSKLLIADDLTVIMGSANINDRSLDGERDSELAVWVNDNTKIKGVLLNGTSSKEVRRFAHDLRRRLWKKHFALEGANGIVESANKLTGMIDKPADPRTWKAIQEIADANLKSYSTVFEFIPRNGSNDKNWVPIWPVCNPRKGRDVPLGFAKPYEEQLPFSEEFWKVSKSYKTPSGIQGFITALPTQWTLGENNHPGMNMILLTQVDPPPPGTTPFACADAHPDTQATTTG